MCTEPSDSNHSNIQSREELYELKKKHHVWSAMPQEPCMADRSDSHWLLSLPLSDQQRHKKLNSSCPCFPFIIFRTETHQLRKLLNSHLFTQMFLKPNNLLVDQLISQSLVSQRNKWTRLNTGHWIQSMHVIGLTGTTDDIGWHGKHYTFAVLSDKE